MYVCICHTTFGEVESTRRSQEHWFAIALQFGAVKERAKTGIGHCFEGCTEADHLGFSDFFQHPGINHGKSNVEQNTDTSHREI